MVDTSILVGIVTGSAAVAGAGVTALVNVANERRKIKHDLAVKEADRARAIADRRRTFEVENLQAAYDALWQALRDSTKTHLEDVRMARTTEYGYGGALLGFETSEEQLAARSKAKMSIRLILDDGIRAQADAATGALSEVALLGVKAKMLGRGPVSAEDGEQAHNRASTLAMGAMDAIAERLREVIAEV